MERGNEQTATCPLCGGATAVQFRLGDFDVADCAACGHRFAAVTRRRGV